MHAYASSFASDGVLSIDHTSARGTLEIVNLASKRFTSAAPLICSNVNIVGDARQGTLQTSSQLIEYSYVTNGLTLDGPTIVRMSIVDDTLLWSDNLLLISLRTITSLSERPLPW